MQQCEIHHAVPWEQGGPTDVDNLQALCSQHHRQQHGPHDPSKRRPGPKNRRPGSEKQPARKPRRAYLDRSRGDPLNQRLLL